MNTLSVLALMTTVSLGISLICWFLLGVPLRHAMVLICDDQRKEVKEISGLFWQRLYLCLILFTPMLCVLLFAPNFERSLADNLLYALRWAVFGGLTLLLILAYLVRKQVREIKSLSTGTLQKDNQS